MPQHLPISTFRSASITLAGAAMVAKGGGRLIYRCPDNPQIVIKLHKPFRQKRFMWLHELLRPRKRRFGPFLHSFIEVDEITAAVYRNGTLPSFTTQFLGFVQTDIGVGAMFEAVLGKNKKLAESLAQYATRTHQHSDMAQAIDTLWDDVIKSGIVVSDPKLANVVPIIEQHAEPRLVFVDGLGERTLIPIQSISRTAHRYACEKARRKMQQDYAALAAKP